MVTTRKSVRFTAAATEMHDRNTQASCSQSIADAAYIVGIRSTLQTMQEDNNRLLFVLTKPVDVDEITVGEFESLTAIDRTCAPSEKEGP
jgi:hypothetical protein